jgi:hypothetical protein
MGVDVDLGIAFDDGVLGFGVEPGVWDCRAAARCMNLRLSVPVESVILYLIPNYRWMGVLCI